MPKKDNKGKGYRKSNPIFKRPSDVAPAWLNNAIQGGNVIGNVAGLAGSIIKLISMINDESIYKRLGDVSPAKNINRPMEIPFINEFSDNGTTGICRFTDFETRWTGLRGSYALHDAAYRIMQAIRANYKTNIPYDIKLIEDYLLSCMFVFIGQAQLGRDIQFKQFPDSSIPSFDTMFLLRAEWIGVDAWVPLKEPEHLSGEKFPDTLDKLIELTDELKKFCRLPHSMAWFLDHYYHNTFIMSADTYNDVLARLIMNEFEIPVPSDGEWVDGLINISQMSLTDFISYCSKCADRYAILVADIDKAVEGIDRIDQYLNSWFDPTTKLVKEPKYVTDPTFDQAMINAYTAYDENLFKDKYIRLDLLPNAPDELTTYLFLGGAIGDTLDEDEPSTLYTAPIPITMLNQVLKFDSNTKVKWPAAVSYSSHVVGSQSLDRPFGYALSSNMHTAITPTAIQHVTSVGDDGITYTFAIEIGKNFSIEESGDVEVTLRSTMSEKVNLGTWSSLTNGTYSYIYPIGLAVYKHGVGVTIYYAASQFDIDAQWSPRIPVTADDNLIYAIDFDFEEDPSSVAALQKAINRSCPAMLVQANTEDAVTGIAAFINELLAMQGIPTDTFTVGQADMDVVYDLEFWKNSNFTNVFSSWTLRVAKTYVTEMNYTAGDLAVVNTFLQVNATPPTSQILATTELPELLEKFKFGLADPSYVFTTVDRILATVGVDVEHFVSEDGTIVYNHLSEIAPYMVDAVDHHIPMVVKSTYYIKANGDPLISQPQLVKESYIPYFYDLKDLRSIMYRMIGSLLYVTAKVRKQPK